MSKTKLFIFLILIFLLLCTSAFMIGKAIFSGSAISDKDKTNYSSITMGDPSDKNCFKLRNGQFACKVATIEISSGKILEDSFKIEN